MWATQSQSAGRGDWRGAYYTQRRGPIGAGARGKSILPNNAATEAPSADGAETRWADGGIPWRWHQRRPGTLHAADVGISVDSATDVAKAAADIVLLERDLGVLHEGVVEGRRTVVNVGKYILMASSANLGNIMSMVIAGLFLPFLPLLPIQVLLTNLIYDIAQTGLPFDRVDREVVAHPVHWDIRLIERFMLVIGPISTLFDVLTFGVLLLLFRATEAQFRTGWFIESLVTQILMIFAVRTRRRTCSPAGPTLRSYCLRSAAWH